MTAAKTPVKTPKKKQTKPLLSKKPNKEVIKKTREAELKKKKIAILRKKIDLHKASARDLHGKIKELYMPKAELCGTTGPE